MQLPNQITSDSMVSAKLPAIDESKSADLESQAKLNHRNEETLPGGFKFTVAQLQRLIDPKDKLYLDSLGGVRELCRGLLVDPAIGLPAEEGPDNADSGAGETSEVTKFRVMIYGKNTLPKKHVQTILELMWNALQDKVLIILSIASAVSLGIGLLEDFGRDHDPSQPRIKWVEGVAIIMAVLAVVLIGSVNDYQKEQQFRLLNAKKEDRKVNAIRGGRNELISIFSIMVGDVIQLEPGDVLPVDGVLISGHNLNCDESSATGESDIIRKQPYSLNRDECKDPFLISGSKISEGVGKFLVTCIGEHSYFGKTMMALQVEQEDTPLEIKLDGLAENIAKIGIVVALALFVILLVKYVIEQSVSGNWPAAAVVSFAILQIVIQSVVIVVIAVPEGLPLAVTLALAYATTRMLKDNNLVRVLSACETMGGATTICSDKTGTLTQNRMTVVSGVVGLRWQFNSPTGIRRLTENLLKSDPSNVPQHATPGTSRTSLSEPLSLETYPSYNTQLSSRQFHHLLVEGCALNSTAFEDRNSGDFIGSKTEIALLQWAKKLSSPDYELMRDNASAEIVQVFPFSSERKCMTTVLRRVLPSGEVFYRAYTKGASEIVLRFCRGVVKAGGGESDGGSNPPHVTTTSASSHSSTSSSTFRLVAMTESLKDQVEKMIFTYAEQALRTICLAYCDFTEAEFATIVGADYFTATSPITSTARDDISLDAISTPSADLHEFDSKSDVEPQVKEDPLEVALRSSKLYCLAIVGIEDPLRDGVVEAVHKCQQAGIFVRMVTGDNMATAKSIAKKCGIYTRGGVVMTGARFRVLSEAERDAILPRLQVLARSSPMDKQILVRRLKFLGETVAVTGDGTNDGPALRMADIGFSMGITGTEVAKEASSIILMDDNFSSIVKAIMWGRCISDSVKKFLQFQLTVNISAVTVAFISALIIPGNTSVFSAVQLLWINLIMDTLAALALATDPPTESLLDRMPESKKSPLITIPMWKMILAQAVFQIVINLLLLTNGGAILHLDTSNPNDYATLTTFIFNTFVFMQLFNEVNCRRVDSHLNIFENILSNRFFIGILAVSVAAQFLIVQYGGIVFQTKPLPLSFWIISVIIGFTSIPFGAIVRLAPDWDGCTICGSDIGRPDTSRQLMNQERLRWNGAIGQVRTQLRVFGALRGTGRMESSALGPSSSSAYVESSRNSSVKSGLDRQLYSSVKSGLDRQLYSSNNSSHHQQISSGSFKNGGHVASLQSTRAVFPSKSVEMLS